MKRPNSPSKCRVAIVGAQRARVAKVVSLITPHETKIIVPSESGLSDFKSKIDESPSLETVVAVEYLPCVATFDSYENDAGETIRYLASVQYHGPDGKQVRGSSLAPFFDADDGERENRDMCFPGVAAVAIGCGVESEQDVAAIETFVQSLSVTGQDESNKQDLVVEAITPSQEYATMKDENDAYRALDTESKAEAIRLRTIGPGKMARFACYLAEKVVCSTNSATRPSRNDCTVLTTSQGIIVPEVVEDVDSMKASTGRDVWAASLVVASDEGVSNVPPNLAEVDPTKTSFACRRCRTVLFGEDALEDPPHSPSMHAFSRRKTHGHSGGGCASLFLSNGIDWMGDMSATEGKFACPKCGTKMGSWKWAGAQCSCGTWVTPAIQVPSSKIDVVAPSGDVPGLRIVDTPITY